MRTRLWLLVVLALAMLCMEAAPQAGIVPRPLIQRIGLWLTTANGSSQLAYLGSTSYQNVVATSLPTITVSLAPQQPILGFGASLTDTSSFLINGSVARDSIMQKLFGSNGIKLSLLRQPLGCSDFCSVPFYSYDDQAGDTALAHFSLAHDVINTLPLLQQAKQLNPHLSMIGTPWSAPAWMKTSGSVYANTNGSLLASDYATYAQYFVKAIQAYQAAGIPVSQLTIQNEPGANASASGAGGQYPGMDFTAADEANFLANYLAPALSAAGLSPQILGYDWNEGASYPLDSYLAALPLGQNGIYATSIHCYGGFASPPAGLWEETECAGGISPYASTAANPFATLDGLIAAMHTGASSYLLWNIAEDQNNGPRPQGSAGCACTPLLTIQTDASGNPTSNVTYNPDFYSLGMVSMFVQPGDTYLATTISGASTLQEAAFVNPYGNVTLVLHNTSIAPVSYAVQIGQEQLLCDTGYFCQPIPAGAIETITWTP